MAREIQLSIFSRYTKTDLLQDVDEKGQLINTHFWGTQNRIDIPIDDEKDSFVTVDEAFIGRLDLLADRFYGDPLLWWVIAQANLIFDQRSMAVGTNLRVPAADNVLLALAGDTSQ
jgi:hypothetical protein